MTAVTARRVTAGMVLAHDLADGRTIPAEVIATAVDVDGMHVLTVDLGWTVAPIRFTPGQRLPLADRNTPRGRSGAGTRHNPKEMDQ